MGSALEAGKVVTTLWLHKHWKIAPKLLRAYLCAAVIVLMFITSMGIFGYLSKAHIEQTSSAFVSSDQITYVNQQVDSQRARVLDDQKVLSQLDSTVQCLYL